MRVKKSFLKVRDLLTFKELDFNLITGNVGLNKKIISPDINRPGLALSGWFNLFTRSRIQVFGSTELNYLNEKSEEETKKILYKLFSFDCSCIIIPKNQEVPSYFIKIAEKFNTSVISSSLSSSELIKRLTGKLDVILAKKLIIHGDLVEVYGIGILILGDSGLGKSECALELVKRGHQFVADDIVELYKNQNHQLFGKGSDIIKHHIEIRGLGIIDVRLLFGISSVKNYVHVDLVVVIEEWDSDKEYDRIGLSEEVEILLGVQVSKIYIPVRIGRNLASLIEVAAMNHRGKEMGHYSAKQFNKRIMNWIQGNK